MAARRTVDGQHGRLIGARNQREEEERGRDSAWFTERWTQRPARESGPDTATCYCISWTFGIESPPSGKDGALGTQLLETMPLNRSKRDSHITSPPVTGRGKTLKSPSPKDLSSSSLFLFYLIKK